MILIAEAIGTLVLIIVAALGIMTLFELLVKRGKNDGGGKG